MMLDQVHPENTEPTLRWGLCVATINRIDILEKCVICALSQTRQPDEIVIVDASEEWHIHRSRIATLASESSVPLVYIPAGRKSLPFQRNEGISAAQADILFLIDDDSLLFPEAADEVLRVYEADKHERVSAVGLTNRDYAPSLVAGPISQKEGAGHSDAIGASFADRKFVRWIARHILLLATDKMFMRYHRNRRQFTSSDADKIGVLEASFSEFIGGCSLTVRRSVALRERFEGNLLSYSPMEDLDATYRYSFHGVNLRAKRAFFFHATSDSGRIKRKQVAQLTMMNMAYFIAKNSDSRSTDAALFVIYFLRRTVAELFKDALKRRWKFPQLRGSLAAAPATIKILVSSRDQLDTWYIGRQSRLLWGTPEPVPGPGAAIPHRTGANE